jgi:hypothetical protein
MERSAIRGPTSIPDAIIKYTTSLWRAEIPDFAALHPGYAATQPQAAIFCSTAISVSGAVTFGEWLASIS